MRSFCLAVMLLFSLPAASQDLPALFDEGMAAVEAAGRAEGDRRDELLDEAIAAFREMLVADPALVRVRLELARAFFLKGEDRLARRHFERVLAGEVPREVAANVRTFLIQIRARRRWDLHAGFRPGAGHQHRRHLGREGHLHQRRGRAAAVHPRRRGPDDVGHRRFDLDRWGVPGPAP